MVNFIHAIIAPEDGVLSFMDCGNTIEDAIVELENSMDAPYTGGPSLLEINAWLQSNGFTCWYILEREDC